MNSVDGKRTKDFISVIKKLDLDLMLILGWFIKFQNL